jgi:uncharacterized protein (DUF885 family)
VFSSRRFAVAIALASAATLQLTANATPAFEKLVDEYFTASFAADPNSATEAGFHDYDGKLNTRSKEAITARVAELKGLKAKLENVDVSKLDKTELVDRLMLIANANAQLLELESIQNWRRNPDSYSSDASSEIFSLIKRNFAPAEDRLRNVISREKQIPVLLKNARENLSGTPKIYTQVALEQLPGTIGFFENAVPDAFVGVTNKELTEEFSKSNHAVIAALKDYEQYLKSDVLPKSVDNFAIGKTNYQNKLLFEEMVDEPTEKLLTNGYAELKRLQNAFVDTGKKIDPSKDPRTVFESISSEHPKPDHLLVSVSDVLNSLRDRSKAVVTIPGEADLKVQETPPFLRALTFASMDAPGPYEMKAKEAYYQVTLPEKDWSSTKVEEHMRSFCDKDLINTSVHEAYPGHYVQGLWMRNAPSKTRKLLYCGTNSEGWAHYCEEMMTDEGQDDPKLRMVQLHDALLRACRYIVGIRMHTDGMTMDQARQFFIKEGYMEAANADRETKRGTMDPTYLVYTLGKLQILSLRDEYKKAMGDKYTLKDFHDSFLAQGCPPVKIVRQALLGQ